MWLNDWVGISHDIAIEHGWWDSDRSDSEVIVLLHSELSECLEAMRLKPLNATQVADQKDKIAEELSDYMIRVFDYCGKKEIDIELEISRQVASIGDIDIDSLMWESETIYDILDLKPDNKIDMLAFAHAKLSTFYWVLVYNGEENYEPLIDSLFVVVLLAKQFDINLEKAIADKTERNKLRPMKHGKKF
jgi:NTP pyrophosphatase (non-canonical NTP hydrolase)